MQFKLLLISLNFENYAIKPSIFTADFLVQNVVLPPETGPS